MERLALAPCGKLHGSESVDGHWSALLGMLFGDALQGWVVAFVISDERACYGQRVTLLGPAFQLVGRQRQGTGGLAPMRRAGGRWVTSSGAR